MAHKRIAELEYENSQLNDQLKQTKQFQATESKHTQAKMQSQIADLELKLENSLKANDTSKNDIQRLLALQQTLSDKWKQESLQFKEHYEEIIKKLQSELVHYRQQCSELEGRYQASRNQCKQTLQQISKEKQLYSQLHDHFLAAKENINQAARKLNQMKAAEAELVVHKKQLGKSN